MAVGGFNGTDPAPTLEQFQALVAAKKIHYFVGGGRPWAAAARRPTPAAATTPPGSPQWVQENFTATTVGGTTVYDLDRSGDP